MRELKYNEAGDLAECLEALAEHHNAVSVHFKGTYPKKPIADTLASFENDIKNGTSRIAVVESAEKILGFCKADIVGQEGKIDYLIVLEEARGKGYGKILINWAMSVFMKCGTEKIEVKGADGNDSINFYEKYGFKPNAHILRLDVK